MGRYFEQPYPARAAIGVAALPKGSQSRWTRSRSSSDASGGGRPARHLSCPGFTPCAMPCPCTGSPALGGCASHKPEDYNGTGLTRRHRCRRRQQPAPGPEQKGPVLEWKIDTANQQASYSNGFEAVDGYLSAKEDQWQASFTGGQTEQLDLSGDKLRVTSQNGNKQTFVKVPTASANTPLGGSFEKALYTAYLGGEWKIVEGRARVRRCASPTTAA